MDHTRHLGIYQVPLHFRVGIVGAGGIGAMTALVLAKMGVVQMTIWDHDVVSEVNIPTQLHPVSDVGKKKVDSLTRTLEHFSDEVMVEPIPMRLSYGSMINEGYNLFITAVDSIEARQDIWRIVAHSRVDWYLDMRMAAEQYQHFLVNLHHESAAIRYEELLMSIQDGDIPDVPCTEKATFYTASLAAGHAGTALRNILRSEAQSQRLIHYIPQQQIMAFGI